MLSSMNIDNIKAKEFQGRNTYGVNKRFKSFDLFGSPSSFKSLDQNMSNSQPNSGDSINLSKLNEELDKQQQPKGLADSIVLMIPPAL